MRNLPCKFRACLIAMCGLWIGGMSLPAHAENPKPTPKTDRCVILVSVDGLANFYLDDPKAHMPTLRRLAKEGAKARGMRASFPTVTWPNHATMVTGCTPAKHGVLSNKVLDRRTGENLQLIVDPVLDKDQLFKVPTIYDVAHRAGMKTGAIVWPATRNARTLDWNAPDMVGITSWEKYGTPEWLVELRQQGIPVDSYEQWVKDKTGGPKRDWLSTRMATQLIDKHAPNLLLLHLIEVDHVEHEFGPSTPDAYWVTNYADNRLRDLVEAIERSPARDRITLIVCSDHGFFPIEKDIRPNVRLRELKLLSLEGKNIARKKSAVAVSAGGGAAIYVLDTERKAEIVARLKTELAKLEGVDTVIPPAKFDTIGQPRPGEHPFAADLWLSAKSGYCFSDNATEDEVVGPRKKGGTHGYLPSHNELLATFVAWGAGIKPGVELGMIDNVDIAPTIARLLGLELPDVDGKPLETILTGK